MGLTRESCRPEAFYRNLRTASVPEANAAVIVAKLELGASNAVFIRGKGGGLNWDCGQKLTCVDSNTWIWLGLHSSERIEFQLLLNDEVWERATAHVIEPGSWIELTPDFEWPEIPRISFPLLRIDHALGSS